MKTTLVLPDDLIKQALQITPYKTKTALVISAIKNLVQQEKIKKLKKFKGRVKIDVDLNVLRSR